jgi:hypothetical protein
MRTNSTLPTMPPQEERRNDQRAQQQAPLLDRQPPRGMAEADAEVGEHAAQVRGADDRAAVGGRHRVLQSAGHGRQQCAGRLVLLEQHAGEHQQQRFDRERHAVTASQLQRGVLHDHAAQRRAADERGGHAEQVQGRARIAVGDRRAETGWSCR